ncbi:ESX-1 secretion-associated protein EspK-like [Schistocerca nitens]|uniref:ESX-1 secretion-associated protein EspK-like n=1 Tax=Schistocerca nitens TaxID=7011 RepID=UPI002117F1E8|nr:ESX-1 secretion-associated protein EspK-like [Schistocerca nitens]
MGKYRYWGCEEVSDLVNIWSAAGSIRAFRLRCRPQGRQPVPLMPPAQLHPGAPQVVAPAPAVPLQSPPPSELMDVDPSAGPPSQAVAVQPVLQPLSLGTPKESDNAAPCPAPTQQPSTQRQETLPLFVGPDAPSRPVPEAAPVVTGVHPDLGFQAEGASAERRRVFEGGGAGLDRERPRARRPRAAAHGPRQITTAAAHRSPLAVSGAPDHRASSGRPLVTQEAVRPA